MYLINTNNPFLVFIFLILIISFCISQYDVSATKNEPFDVKHDATKAIGKDGKNVITAECAPEPEVESQIVGDVVQMENGKYALLAPNTESFKEKPVDSLLEQGVYSPEKPTKDLASLAEVNSLLEQGVDSIEKQAKDLASLAEVNSLLEQGVYSPEKQAKDLALLAEVDSLGQEDGYSPEKQAKDLDEASLPEVNEDITYGTNKDDFIISSPETTATSCGLVIDAKRGDDEVQGGWGNDIIYGKDGDDTLQTSDGNDQIYGGNGNDRLVGGFGSNLLYGEKGDDQLFGGDGDDQIAGGSGADTFYCGSGIDEVKDYNKQEGDNIIDKGGGLKVGDEVGCEIGVGANFNFGTTQSGDLTHKGKR